jgi:hypothetical protein
MRFICAVVLMLGLALPAEAMKGETMKRLATLAFTFSLAVSLTTVVAYSQNHDVRPPRRPFTDEQEAPRPTPKPGPKDPHVVHDKETRIPRPFHYDWEKHPRVEQRVTAMLPQGMNLQQASSGFRGVGEFISTLHASANLGIPFPALKAKVTGPNAVSLGQAIQELKPGFQPKDVRNQVEKAQQQAKATQF